MSDFSIFFPMGIEHITDLNGLDHILFITALCMRYLISDWKKLLILVTAFTIGHSITLALSTLNIISLPQRWTEFFIALTIVITAFNNWFVKDFTFKTRYPAIYFFALFFGLIHGLGFANYIRFMLAKGQGLGWSLFGFNVGLEAGQVVVVLCILLVSYLAVDRFKLNRKWWVWVLSAAAFCIAFKMAIDRWPLAT